MPRNVHTHTDGQLIATYVAAVITRPVEEGRRINRGPIVRVPELARVQAHVGAGPGGRWRRNRGNIRGR